MNHLTVTKNSFSKTICAGLVASSMVMGCASVSTQSVSTESVSTQSVENVESVIRTAQAVGGDASDNPNVETITIPVATEKETILHTIDSFFEALATSDADAIERLVSADATEVTVYPEEEGRPPRYGRVRSIVGAMRAGQLPKIEEPYWDPIVLQRKGLAVVWAPYEVWANERLAHCGIDVFTLSYQKTSWVINSIQWTQEPTACEELWPEGRSVLRPGMFNDSSQ